MSQLQYIGARYVPIWYENTDDQSADWQPNVEYEPLTFVTTSNNHLYLSKKTVPDTIGNPANNISYWLDMGVFTNAQIAQLQQEVDDMKDGTIPGSLQNQITENSNDIDTLNDTVDSLRNKIDVSHRKFICIGDSYAVPVNTDNIPSLVGFFEIFKNILGIPDSNYVKNAAGGTGFATQRSAGNSFLQMLQSTAGSLPTGWSTSDVTDILVVGGTNDAYQTGADTRSHLATFMTYAKSTFPNATIYIGFNGWGLTSTAKYRYTDRIADYKICINYGAVYLEGIEYAYHKDSMYQTDGHPNLYGEETIANALAQAYLGGATIPYSALQAVTTTIDPQWDAGSSVGTLFSQRIGDITIFSMNTTGSFNKLAGLEPNHSGFLTVHLFDISDTWVTGMSYNLSDRWVVCEIGYTDETAHTFVEKFIDAKLMISSKSVNLLLPIRHSNWTLKYVLVRDFNIVFNTLNC